jgi:hypothetical protein
VIHDLGIVIEGIREYSRVDQSLCPMYRMAAGWGSDSTNLEGLTTMPNSAQKFYAK